MGQSNEDRQHFTMYRSKWYERPMPSLDRFAAPTVFVLMVFILIRIFTQSKVILVVEWGILIVGFLAFYIWPWYRSRINRPVVVRWANRKMEELELVSGQCDWNHCINTLGALAHLVHASASKAEARKRKQDLRDARLAIEIQLKVVFNQTVIELQRRVSLEALLQPNSPISPSLRQRIARIAAE